MAVSSTTGGLRTGVCLSTDRPQNPYDGQVIYETDTNRTLVWDNSAWVVMVDPALLSFSGTGATVTADAMTVAGENVTPYTGRRNLLYNGAMNVWQRSTNATTTGTDNYAAMDRWRNRTGTGGASMNVSRQSSGLSGFQYCARVQRVSGNADVGSLDLIQTLETTDSIVMAGKDVTFSFYARKGADYSPTDSLLHVYVTSGQGTDQYWASFTNASVLVNNETASLTTSWQRFTFTASVPSTATQLYVIIVMRPSGTAGANDYYEVTGTQLEVGDKATPFEHRSYGEELALCQRYYEIGNAWKRSQNNDTVRTYYEDVQYKVTKRTSPTVTSSYSNNTNVGYACSLISSGANSGIFTWNASSGVDFQANLSWTASAEL